MYKRQEEGSFIGEQNSSKFEKEDICVEANENGEIWLTADTAPVSYTHLDVYKRQVAGRAAFFMVPSFKPVVAVTIISAVCFGAESGFLVGALSMLSSNMLFGQGPWTPWQMFAAGIIGFLAGILFQKGWLKARKISLCIYGFLATVFIYGGIMNPASLVMTSYATVSYTHLC